MSSSEQTSSEEASSVQSYVSPAHKVVKVGLFLREVKAAQASLEGEPEEVELLERRLRILGEYDDDYESYESYRKEYVKEMLMNDAYFTGFMALMADTQSSKMEALHKILLVVVLMFTIICQISMVLFMRGCVKGAQWLDFLQSVWDGPQDLSTGKVSPFLLFLGLSIFYQQIQIERTESEQFAKVIWNGWRSGCYPNTILHNTITAFLVFSKVAMPWILLWSGMHTLLTSQGNIDVVMNCTALNFVFGLDDIAMQAACPRITKPMHDFRQAVLLTWASPHPLFEKDWTWPALLQVAVTLFQISFLGTRITHWEDFSIYRLC